jgi:SAM-dependent methyltransferase
MSSDYFRHIRYDIGPLLPASARRIVDVGAGVGATSSWLKSRYPGCHTIGLEGDASNRDELARNVDEAVIVDLNGPIPDVGAPDLVLCLDVLEHLVQPLDALVRVTANMTEDGIVIASLPNVGHASVSIRLMLQARFEYQDAGILDRTHLRFFDRVSTIDLMNRAGLIIGQGVRSGFAGPRTRVIDGVTFGLIRDQLTKQYIVAGRRRKAGDTQDQVKWRTT